MPFPDAKYPPPKRVVVEVYNGYADVSASDPGVDWELIDWDSIRTGDAWDDDQITRLAEWGAGLVSPILIASLRDACSNREDE